MDTGGRYTENVNDLTLGMARAQRDLTCVYSIGLYVKESAEDRTRDVRVYTSRPGLDVLHPSKYVFRSPSSRRESRLFAAWTQPQQLVMWFGPDEFTVESAEIDLRVGGAYRITIVSPDGGVTCHFGEYVEVDRPRDLVFTWVLADQDCAGSRGQAAQTLVSLRFTATADGTELELVHERLPTEVARQGHESGWVASLQALSNFVGD